MEGDEEAEVTMELGEGDGIGGKMRKEWMEKGKEKGWYATGGEDRAKEKKSKERRG